VRSGLSLFQVPVSLGRFQAPTNVTQQSKFDNNNQEGNRTMKESKSLTKDPICGMTVNEATALHSERDGKLFYFCGDHRRQMFLSAPADATPEGKSGCCCGQFTSALPSSGSEK